MYIIVNTYTAPSMSTMVTSSATPSTSQYPVPQLNMHQYVATTPSYHIHCQGCHQQWTPPTVIHCRSYTPEAPYLFQ
ncbi:Ciliogenesis and planar polarity effector [Trichinella pseudospiralis]